MWGWEVECNNNTNNFYFLINITLLLLLFWLTPDLVLFFVGCNMFKDCDRIYPAYVFM